MKKIPILLLGLAMVASLGAQTLTYLNGGVTKFPVGPRGGFESIDAALIDRFEKAHPGVKVRSILIDLSTGSTMSMDALVAAGNAPDVYDDFAGRAGKYAVPEYALDMTPYLTAAEIADINPAILAYVKKQGKILALFGNSWANAFAVNLDMLASVGYTMPSSGKWTIDQYLALGKALKAKGLYLHYLFAKNQSSDQWWMPWFYAFGARQFNPGDYSATRINSAEGIAALNFMKSLVDLGYAPPNPGELDDDMALEAWATGKVATLNMQAGHAGPAIQSAVDQKAISKPFAYAFVEMPHLPGVAHTPTSAGPQFIVSRNSTDAKRNALVAEFAKLMASAEKLTVVAEVAKNYPALLSVKPKIDDPHWGEIKDVVSSAGVADLGITLPKFSAIRGQLFPLLQEFYANRLTAPQVLSRYEVAVNAILREK